MKSSRASRFGLALLASVLTLAPAEMNGHCDTMNGPVVVAAQKALDQGDVRLALFWVRAGDEARSSTGWGPWPRASCIPSPL